MTDIKYNPYPGTKPPKSGEYRIRGRESQVGVAAYFTDHQKGRGWIVVGPWEGSVVAWAYL